MPPELETTLLGGLEAEPADRYADMQALSRDLEHVLANEPIEYSPPGAFVAPSRPAYRRSRVLVNGSPCSWC